MQLAIRWSIRLQILIVMFGLTAFAQTLGDYAREQRAKKPAASPTAKVYTNDNLPTTAGAANHSSSGAADTASLTNAGTTAKPTSESKAEDWHARLAETKKRISKLIQETDETARDFARRLVKFSQTPAQDAVEKQRIAEMLTELGEKRRELAEAGQGLQDMKEDMRRAGVLSSSAEYQEQFNEMQKMLDESWEKLEDLRQHLLKGTVPSSLVQ